MTQNLKSISAYLERRAAAYDVRRDMLNQLRKGTIMLIGGNAAGMVILGTALLGLKPEVGPEGLQLFALSLAAFIFAVALLCSVFCAGDVGLIEIGKTLRDVSDKESKTVQRNLFLAIVGFFFGIGLIAIVMFQVMIENLGKLLSS